MVRIQVTDIDAEYLRDITPAQNLVKAIAQQWNEAFYWIIDRTHGLQRFTAVLAVLPGFDTLVIFNINAGNKQLH